MTDAQVRQAYRQACYGAGAEPRRHARTQLEHEAHRRGLAEAARLLEALNLDLATYFATRPV